MSSAIIDDKFLPIFVEQKGGQILPLTFSKSFCLSSEIALEGSDRLRLLKISTKRHTG